jgi:hypothetical protein
MKLVFLDESGKRHDDISVTAGVVIDAYRVHKARRDWSSLLDDISWRLGKPLPEFHMSHVYSGNEIWYGCPIDIREWAILSVLDWIVDNKYSLVFSASEKNAYNGRVAAACPMVQTLASRWVIESFHIALCLNKVHKSLSDNKGKTLMVFDEGAGYERSLSSLLVDPPQWSDSYYGRAINELALSEITDTSFFADSMHAPLIQIADAIAFILRRYSEIGDSGRPERFKGELANLQVWVNRIADCFVPSAHRYKKTGRCVCAQMFWDIAPVSLRSI